VGGRRKKKLSLKLKQKKGRFWEFKKIGRAKSKTVIINNVERAEKKPNREWEKKTLAAAYGR